MQIFKKLAAIVLASTITLGLCSCKDAGEPSSGGVISSAKNAVYASKDHVFTNEKVVLPDGLDSASYVFCTGDKLCVIGYVSRTEGEGENAVYKSKTVLRTVGLDGNIINETTLIEEDENTDNSGVYIQTARLDTEGNLLAIFQKYTYSPETNEYEEHNFLRKYGQDGQMLCETSLNVLEEECKKTNGADYYFYISSFCNDLNGNIYMLCNNIITVMDKDGEFQYLVSLDNSDDQYMNGPYLTKDGKVVVTVTKSSVIDEKYVSEAKIKEIDTDTHSFGAEYDFDMVGTLMDGAAEYDLLINRSTGLAGYDIETGEAETIIDWIKAGIDDSTIDLNGISVLEDGRILVMSCNYDYTPSGGYDYSREQLTVNILTKQDPEAVPDRKLIKLYSIYLDGSIKHQILDFNNANTEYEIEYTDYSQYMGADWNWDNAVTKLNNDMIAGNLPDILVINDQLNVDSYISKGLLANLYDFMDNDESIDRSDYVESLFSAMERNRALYELPLSFSIDTMIGKTSKVGETSGWTMSEFLALADANPDSSLMGSSYTKNAMLSILINADFNNLVNKDSGECSFDSDEFIKMLEYANRFPKDYDDINDSDPDYWANWGTQWREDRVLLSDTVIQQFTSIVEQEQGYFGDTITFKGYPGAAGNGSMFIINNKLAITSKAANPDGAWEFVKYFMSDEFQDGFAEQNSYNFPIKKSSLDKLMAVSKERPNYENEDGTIEYYDSTFWLGETEIKLNPNTDADNQKVMDLINSTTNIYRYNQGVMDIVNEEVDAYFEGQKSAEDVAAIIQNRVSTYVAEGR